MSDNEYSIADKRYNSLVNRSFKRHLELVLYEHFYCGKSLPKTLIQYADHNLPEKVIKQYGKDYENMSKVRERNKKIKMWIQENEKQVSDFKIAHRNYFENHILKKQEFREMYFKDHESARRRCCYCGITEDKIQKLVNNNQIHTKRYYSRGKTMVVDRIKPNDPYEHDNIKLTCYWCNNAKSDEFSAEEFIKIGQKIQEIWESRLGKKI